MPYLEVGALDSLPLSALCSDKSTHVPTSGLGVATGPTAVSESTVSENPEFGEFFWASPSPRERAQ